MGVITLSYFHVHMLDEVIDSEMRKPFITLLQRN